MSRCQPRPIKPGILILFLHAPPPAPTTFQELEKRSLEHRWAGPWLSLIQTLPR